jgi:hypothetical protein
MTRIGLGLGLCACLALSCSGSEESLRETSSSGDSGSDGTSEASAGDSGFVVIDSGTGDASNECIDDSECINSEYAELVRSEADCYCPSCSHQPLLVVEHQLRAAAWTKFCSEWFETANCADTACSAFAFCQNGKCALPDPI